MNITTEINTQIVVSLLKEHNIKKVIVSPGNTNVAFVGTVQEDPFFEVYSCVDERSAAYMACGLSEASNEPVVISCTGATASRNYMPGLTEAYYRKLPILAITSTQNIANVGHLVAQVIDRSSIPNDITKISITLPIVKDYKDTWECEVKTNTAILELTRNGGGPVHINLPTTYELPFVNLPLPKFNKIERFNLTDRFPNIKGKVAVFVGSGIKWTDEKTKSLENFCRRNNGVVFCDHCSGYKGKYSVQQSILAVQDMMDKSNFIPDLTIHIGEVSGAEYNLFASDVWRVNPDGQIRDTVRRLKKVFEMDEEQFFNRYLNGNSVENTYYQYVKESADNVRGEFKDCPFSNIWVASILSKKMPEKSFLHFGIYNSLRAWNFFELPESIRTTSNVGGFGIDGPLSSVIGSSLTSDGLYYCVLGDLAFFYDMNALGNRHVKGNLRILVVNNGKGTEFKNYNHHASYFKEDADKFIAASGHYGNRSKSLIKNYVTSLGFDYISASTKDEFLSVHDSFVSNEVCERPMVFEVFTNSVDESDALQVIRNLKVESKSIMKEKAKRALGKNTVSNMKKLFGK